MAITPASDAPDRKPRKVRLTLALDGTPYTVRPLPRAELPPDAVRGFVLTRTDARVGKVRHAIVEGLDGLACSCGDSTYRQLPAGGRCKHIEAALACGLF